MEFIDPQKQRQEQQRQEQLRRQDQQRQARKREENARQANEAIRGKSALKTPYKPSLLDKISPPAPPKYSQLNLFEFHGIDPNQFRTPLTFSGMPQNSWDQQEQDRNSHWLRRKDRRQQQQQEREERYKYNQLDLSELYPETFTQVQPRPDNRTPEAKPQHQTPLPGRETAHVSQQMLGTIL
jgi:hypothetical protein